MNISNTNFVKFSVQGFELENGSYAMTVTLDPFRAKGSETFQAGESNDKYSVSPGIRLIKTSTFDILGSSSNSLARYVRSRIPTFGVMFFVFFDVSSPITADLRIGAVCVCVFVHGLNLLTVSRSYIP